MKFVTLRTEHTRPRGDYISHRNGENYVMTKSTPTLTQSGLLAVLLQRQRYKVIQSAWRRAHRKHLRAAFWSILTWPRRALTARTLVNDSSEALEEPFRGTLNLSAKPFAMARQIHTYTELRQQIHDELRIQYPEWVEPNGESSMCLMELLDSLTRRGIQRVYRYSSSRLRTGTKPDRHRGGVIRLEVN
jgi:hypothetical protein